MRHFSGLVRWMWLTTKKRNNKFSQSRGQSLRWFIHRQFQLRKKWNIISHTWCHKQTSEAFYSLSSGSGVSFLKFSVSSLSLEQTSVFIFSVNSKLLQSFKFLSPALLSNCSSLPNPTKLKFWSLMTFRASIRGWKVTSCSSGWGSAGKQNRRG